MMGGRDDAAVAVLVLLGGSVLLGAALVVLGAVTDVHTSAARARTAADAAALAAANASPLGGGHGDACTQARDLARANDAVLTLCRATVYWASEGTGGPAVEVEVRVDPRWKPVADLIDGVHARAAAALLPRQRTEPARSGVAGGALIRRSRGDP